MFSFQALNCRTVTESPQCAETPNQLSADNDCSMISLPEKLEPLDAANVTQHATPKVKGIHETVEHQKPDFSPSILELLKPKKPVTRESEEVRLLKLYRCALTMYSDGQENHHLAVKSVLESITSSFLLKSDNLPLQLKSVKIATYKLLGDIYLKACQYEKATRIYLKTSYLDPSDLNVWLRLARSAVQCGRFETTTLALDHILVERPNHPLALRLSLPVYFAMSEFETCLQLCLRCLCLDAGNEQAVYYLQRITALQPSLRHLLSDDLCEGRPDLLTETISPAASALAEFEANKLRAVYRKKMDMEAESRRVKTIDFPLPTGKLTWCSLADTVLDLFDRLLKETTLACILNFETLILANQPESTKVDLEQEQQQPGEPMEIEVSVNGRSPDNAPGIVVVGEVGKAVTGDTLPTENKSPAEYPEGNNVVFAESLPPPATPVNSNNNQNEDGTEKRRSARARQSIDLAETPSRNRARRSTVTDSELKAQEYHCGSSKERKNDRTELALDLQAILPKLFRDLAEHYTVTSSQRDFPQPSDGRMATPANGWLHQEPHEPPESVVEFLLLCQAQKPNIVSLGIALMLTISRMTAHTWSKELASSYLALFSRFKDSLPYHYLWPSNELRESIDDRENAAVPSTLPADVLFLRHQPSLSVLLRLHCTYLELYLEELDHQAHFDKAYCEMPSMETHFHSLRPLFDVFALYEPDCPDYVEVQIHRYWISYLTNSLTDNFTVMQTYLTLMKDYLVEHGLTVRRNYSVLHGDLSEGYISHMLNRVENASNVERLTKLSGARCHSEVVAEISALLQGDCVKGDEFSPRLNRGPCLRLTAVTDCLHLLHNSLNYLVDELGGRKTTTTTMTTTLAERQRRVVTCYQGAVVLLGQVLHLLPQDSSPTLVHSVPLEETCSLAVEALHLLCNIWELIMEYCTIANGVLADRTSESTDLPTVSSSLLRLDPPTECLPNGDHSEDTATNTTTGISIGAACKGVVTMLDLLVLCLRAPWQSLPPMSVLFSRHVVSCIYEHLACLEQTIPICLLPAKLRVYQSEWLTCSLSPQATSSGNLLRSASGGTLAAPPSLLWLHQAHQIFSMCLTAPSPVRYLRLLPLLRQTLVRCSDLLSWLTSLYTDSGEIGQYDDSRSWDVPTTSSQSDEDAGSNGAPLEAPQPVDEETVACVDEPQQQQAVKVCWPVRCAPLVEVLANAVRCLLPPAIFSQITTVDDDPAVPPGYNDVLDVKQRVRERSCVDALPRWLVTLRRVCSEDDNPHLCRLEGPSAWWTVTDESATSVSEEEKANTLAIDWQCMQTIFNVCHPIDLPEYDSVRTLSISAEFSSLLLETTKLLPKDELNCLFSDNQVEVMLQTKSNEVLDLPDEPQHTSLLTKRVFYLIADYYMKNNQFALAVEYYLRDLSVCPWRPDTWAALALIYHSDLDQILNLTNLKTERVNPDSVSRCLRCFDVALSLLPNSITLLIERGCLAYQLHSYASRIVKKSVYRTYAEAHVHLCRKWQHQMLEVSRKSYEQVLHSLTKSCPLGPGHEGDEGTTSPEEDSATRWTTGEPVSASGDGPQLARDGRQLAGNGPRDKRSSHRQQDRADEEEEWLCHYMLAKCATKEARRQPSAAGDLVADGNRLLAVVRRYKQALEALDLAGAKYPKKIIVYHKLPCRSVEAVEVYYAIHAVCLKFLLDHHRLIIAGSLSGQDEASTCLSAQRDFLAELNECNFITSVSKVRRPAKKRSAMAAGLPPRPVATASAQKSQRQGEEGEAHAAGTADETAKPVCQSAVVAASANQEDFIDLTEDNPCYHLAFSDANRSTASVGLEALWLDCFERCQSAMLTVLQRLPLHYKAMYRLADLYLRAPHINDTNRAVAMLLGSTDEQDKLPVGGLFKDRRLNNFFHGVWRIPTPDIDRSGNFAAHMYRSVYLTLSLLQSRGDWRHLMHIFHQLRKQPPEEKRGFLGEGDRIFLARRAFNLIQPTLLTWLQNVAASNVAEESLPSPPPQGGRDRQAGLLSLETLTQIYRLHCIAYSRNCSLAAASAAGATSQAGDSPGSNPEAASSVAAAAMSGYTEVLQLAYRLCPAFWGIHGPNAPLQLILQRCTELTSTVVQPRVEVALAQSAAGNSSAPRGH